MNSPYWISWYLLASDAPSLTRNWSSPAAVWNAAAVLDARLWGRKDPPNQIQFLPGRLVLTVFPVSDRSGIDAEHGGQLLLSHSPNPAGFGDPFRERSCDRKRVIPEESDDSRDILHLRLSCVAFPMEDARLSDPDLLGNLPLKESEVDPAGAEVIA